MTVWETFASELETQTRLGRRRSLAVRRPEGVYLREPDGRRLLNFGGNDYLGVVAEGLSAGTDVAAGAGASPLVCGWSAHHARLARRIADLEKTEAAAVFPSGFAACSGAVATFARRGDLLLSDSLNHASLIDGCRLSKAERVVYPHIDVEWVERYMSAYRRRFDQVWIVTDSVFSMDGDVAPLERLVEVARRYDANLLVDEAHATGVLGDQGGGLCDALELSGKVPLRIGTLSKALGHQGGFVAGPQVAIDYLIQFCRPLVFSTALSPAVAASAVSVVEQLPGWNDRRQHLHTLSARLRTKLGDRVASSSAYSDSPTPTHDAGALPHDAAARASTATSRRPGLASAALVTPIHPVLIGQDDQAVKISQYLCQCGFFVPAIRPPTVPEGTARLRISLSAAHSLADVDALSDCLCDRLSSIHAR